LICGAASGGSKIKVNQAGSRWIKVNKPFFKHFFMQESISSPNRDPIATDFNERPACQKTLKSRNR
jgi:hypothetical protein